MEKRHKYIQLCTARAGSLDVPRLGNSTARMSPLHGNSSSRQPPLGRGVFRNVSVMGALRSGYTMRTKCAISDAFVRDCVFAYCASVAQYVYSPSAEHYFRLRNSAISDERVRDCALSTHSVFRPLRSVIFPVISCHATSQYEGD